jgi:hypothetical protein
MPDGGSFRPDLVIVGDQEATQCPGFRRSAVKICVGATDVRRLNLLDGDVPKKTSITVLR